MKIMKISLPSEKPTIRYTFTDKCTVHQQKYINIACIVILLYMCMHAVATLKDAYHTVCK